MGGAREARRKPPKATMATSSQRSPASNASPPERRASSERGPVSVSSPTNTTEIRDGQGGTSNASPAKGRLSRKTGRSDWTVSEAAWTAGPWTGASLSCIGAVP